jgi:hypothetical protein
VSRESRRREDDAAREWKGAYLPYDILREATIALGVVLALTVLLTILFSSPDDPPSTIKQWSRTDPVDFVTTATTELDSSSTTGSYGPPYNHASDGQHIAFIRLAKWLVKRRAADRNAHAKRIASSGSGASSSPEHPFVPRVDQPRLPGGVVEV